MGGDTYEFVGVGPPTDAPFEIESRGGRLIVVANWSQSVVTVRPNGQALETASRVIRQL